MHWTRMKMADLDHENKKVEPKKFYEVVNDRVRDALTRLIAETPELEAAAVALLYSPEIGEPPACLVIGNLADTQMLCRLGIQTSRLQSVVARGVMQHMARASEVHAQIMKECNDAGQTQKSDEQESGPLTRPFHLRIPDQASQD